MLDCRLPSYCACEPRVLCLECLNVCTDIAAGHRQPVALHMTGAVEACLAADTQTGTLLVQTYAFARPRKEQTQAFAWPLVRV